MIQVRVSTQPTRIETSTQPATLTISSRPAKLEITSAAAKVEISQPQGTLSIDSYPSRAAIGLKNSRDMLGEFAQYGQQAVQELTAKYVQDGNRLADITNGGNSVGQLAAEHSTAPQFDITWAYVPLPDIRYQMNRPEISVTPGQFNMSAQPVTVQGNYTPGSVDTRVTQYASISVSTAEAGNMINIQR